MAHLVRGVRRGRRTRDGHRPGHPAADTVGTLLAERLDPEAVAAAAVRQLELQYDDLSDVVAAEGAHELLALVDELGLPWAVVTSADERLAKARLGAARIAAPVLVTTDDILRGKPDPAGYLLAARRLAAAPTECLVVEDAEAGVIAGHAAGATVAALKGVPADFALTTLHELTAALSHAAADSRSATLHDLTVATSAALDGTTADLPTSATRGDQTSALTTRPPATP